MYEIFLRHEEFHLKPQKHSAKVLTAVNYNSTMEEQRDATFKRILLLRDLGLLDGYLTSNDVDFLREKAAMHEAIGIFDHSLAVKLGVHIHLWYHFNLEIISTLHIISRDLSNFPLNHRN